MELSLNLLSMFAQKKPHKNNFIKSEKAPLNVEFFLLNGGMTRFVLLTRV